MAQASRQIRKIRRIKRERALAFRSLAEMNWQFEQLRKYAQDLRLRLDAVEVTPKAPTTPAVTITRLPEEDNGELENHPTD